MKRRCHRRIPAGVTLADLLVVVVLIPLLMLLLIGCYRRTRCAGSGRTACASNLRQIGQAIMLYSNEHKGEYPRWTYAPGTRVTPTWGTQDQPNDITAALFLLLRKQDITAGVFTCPSSDAERWDFGGGTNTQLNWHNWPGRVGVRKHLSYSYANPYPDNAAVKRGYKLNNSLGAEFAVAADINPGTASDGSSVLAVTSTSKAREMRQGNSRNHDQDGQNVLFGDGHVEFVTNPFAGVQRDMIYARRAGASGFASSAVVDSPYDADDSVLLPTDDD